jgi:hypothetical protein
MDDDKLQEHEVSVKITEVFCNDNIVPKIAIRALCKCLGAAIGNSVHKDDRLKVFDLAARLIKKTIDDCEKFELHEKSKEGKNV